MPHAELKYSSDLALDAAAVLRDVEAVIQRHDAASGACKGRAYPADTFHHTHLLLTLSLLPKAHRDDAFTHALMADVETAVRAHISAPCHFSFALDYSGAYYITHPQA